MSRGITIFAAASLLLLAALVFAYTRSSRVTVSTGEPPAQLTSSSTVQSLRLSEAVDGLGYLPSGELIVLAKSRGGDHARHLVKCRPGSTESSQILTTDNVLMGLAITSDGNIAYTGQWRTGPNKECELLQIDTREGRILKKFAAPSLDGFGFRITSDPTAVGVSPDGRLVAVGFKLVDDEYVAGGHIGGEICVWNTETGNVLWRNRTVHTDIVRSVVFSADSERLFSAGEDSLIRVWDAQSDELLRTFTGVLWDGVASMQISPDGRYLATGGNGREEGGRIRVWDLKENTQIHKFSPFRQGSRVHVAFSATGVLIAAGESKSSTVETPRFDVRAWQADTFSKASSIGNGDGFVRDLATSPSGMTAAVGTFEGEVLQFDFELDAG